MESGNAKLSEEGAALERSEADLPARPAGPSSKSFPLGTGNTDTAETPSQGAAGGGAVRMLFGLMVVWGSFFLVALAQDYSYNEIRFDLGNAGASWRPRAFLAGLDVRDKITMPVESLTFHDKSPRETVALLLGRVGLSVSEQDLELLSEEKRNVKLTGSPYYQALNTLIDDPAIGFSLSAEKARLFSQRIKNVEPALGELRQFDWEARVELGENPTVLIPAARSDLWCLFAVAPRPVGPGSAYPRIAVEIWRGARRVASGEGVLGEDHIASLNFSAQGTIILTIERAEPAEERLGGVAHASQYKVRIFFRASGGGDARGEPEA